MKGDVKDRSVHSGLWKRVFPYSDLAIPTTGETSFSSTAFALTEILATLFSMLKLINFKYLGGDQQLASWFHRMLYTSIDNLLSMQAFSDDLNITLIIILAVVALLNWITIAASIWMAARSGSATSTMQWLSSNSLFGLSSVRNLAIFKSVLAMEIVIDACLVVLKSSAISMGVKVLAIFVLGSIVVDLGIIICYSIDIHYKPRNLLQGRTYYLFTSKVLGLWALLIFKHLISESDDQTLNFLLNLLVCLHSVWVFYILYKTKNFYLYPKMEIVHNILCLVYFVESIGALVYSLNRDLKDILDMDLVAIIAYPMFFLLYRGIENRSSDDILSKRSQTSFDSLDTAILYLEKLFYCFGQNQDDRFKMYLQMNIVSHCNGCRDPMCLCPLLRETIDVKSGSAGRTAKSTFNHFLNSKKGASQFNSTVKFDSASYVEKLKVQNQMIARLSTTGERDELKIRRTKDFTPDEVYRVLAIKIGRAS